MNAQFVYSKQGLAPLLFQQDVLGTEIPTVVGEYEGRLLLPQLGGVQPRSGFRDVVAPQRFHTGVLPKLYDGSKRVNWGYQVRLPEGETLVASFLLEFDLAREQDVAREQITHVEGRFEHWFSTLRDWLEVLTRQDLSIDEPLGGTSSRANYVWSWSDGDRRTTTTAARSYGVIQIPDYTNAISPLAWALAVERCNKGRLPPQSHLILRDARARLLRDHTNYSTVFAAMAAELVIKDEVRRVLEEKGYPESFIKRMQGGTLGTLEDTSRLLGIALPPTLRKDLIENRNKAMHKGLTVSKEEAHKALTIATQVVDQFAAAEFTGKLVGPARCR